jgi:hypothetical protein
MTATVGPVSSLIGPAMLAAQRLVACGCNVLPLLPRDKKPATNWKPLQSTRLVDRDPDQVDRYLRSWWDPQRLEHPCPECGTSHAWGHAMPCRLAPREPIPMRLPNNLGIVTGAVSGIVVVDVDDQRARDLVEKTCGWPRTVRARTRKGWHLYFRRPADGSRNGVRRGEAALDVRGDGGYVVAPPSVHPTGFEYRWEVSPFTFSGGMWPPLVMPDELHALLWPTQRVTATTAPTAVLTTKYIEVALEREVAAVATATEGLRNDQLNRSAYSLARFVRSGQLDPSTYVDNLSRAAVSTGLPETEVRRTLASALQGRA